MRVTNPRPHRSPAEWVTPERLAVLDRLWPGYLPGQMVLAVLRSLPGPEIEDLRQVSKPAVQRLHQRRPPDVKGNHVEIETAIRAAMAEFGVAVPEGLIIGATFSRAIRTVAAYVAPPAPPKTIPERVALRRLDEIGVVAPDPVRLVPPGRHPAPVGGYRMGRGG